MAQPPMCTGILDKEELSPQQAFALFWSDEELQDMSLEGSDGLTVPANRAALAAKSRVFRKMLLGDFSEARRDVVKIESFPSTVLRALVEYICTDTTSVLAAVPHEKLSVEGHMDDLQLLLSLTRAGEFFCLPRLCQRAKEAVSVRLLRAQPTLSLAFWEACHEDGPSIQQDLADLALSNVRSCAFVDLVGSLAKLPSTFLLEKIFQDSKVALNDWEKFEILNLWQSLDHQEESNPVITAKALVAKHVHLNCIHPHKLATTVSSSGLVSMPELSEAYKNQALEAANSRTFLQRPPSTTLWRKSRSAVFSSTSASSVQDFVECQSPMVAGITYSWTIRVEDEGPFFLGIHGKATVVNDQTTFWYYSTGRACLKNEILNVKLPTYKGGSIVTFVLNLVPTGDRPGILWASVDGGDRFTLHDNLLEVMGRDSIVPVACIQGCGSLHILSFVKSDSLSKPVQNVYSRRFGFEL